MLSLKENLNFIVSPYRETAATHEYLHIFDTSVIRTFTNIIYSYPRAKFSVAKFSIDRRIVTINRVRVLRELAGKEILTRRSYVRHRSRAKYRNARYLRYRFRN